MTATEEISHGKRLAQHHPERVWGWNTAAGSRRLSRRANLIVDYSRLNKNHLVMEIGCGTGVFTKHFADTGAKIHAVDISPDLISLAEENLRQYANVTFLIRDFEKEKMLQTYDAVIGSSILHHLNINQALSKIFSCLKPGGKIAFAEPNILNPQVFLQKKIPAIKRKMGDTPDETALMKTRVLKSLEMIGYQNTAVIPFDWLHPKIPKKRINAVKKVEKHLEKIPFLKEFSGSLLVVGTKPTGK